MLAHKGRKQFDKLYFHFGLCFQNKIQVIKKKIRSLHQVLYWITCCFLLFAPCSVKPQIVIFKLSLSSSMSRSVVVTSTPEPSLYQAENLAFFKLFLWEFNSLSLSPTLLIVSSAPYTFHQGKGIGVGKHKIIKPPFSMQGW